MDHVRVFQNLGKEETLLHVVKTISSSNVDVLNSRVARSYMACRIDSKEGIPGPVLVLYVISIFNLRVKKEAHLGVTSDAVSIVVTFNNFWSQDIVG